MGRRYRNIDATVGDGVEELKLPEPVRHFLKGIRHFLKGIRSVLSDIAFILGAGITIMCWIFALPMILAYAIAVDKGDIPQLMQSPWYWLPVAYAAAWLIGWVCHIAVERGKAEDAAQQK